MRTPWTGQVVKPTLQPITAHQSAQTMRARLAIILPILLATSACAVHPVKAVLDLTGHKPAPKPAHTFPAPPVTPSSVSN